MTRPKKTDIEMIESITSKIILLTETILEELATIKDDPQATQQNLQDVLFGGKASIINGLNTTADLMAKLKKLKPDLIIKKPEPSEDDLSADDLSPIQNFIKRKKEEYLRNQSKPTVSSPQ